MHLPFRYKLASILPQELGLNGYDDAKNLLPIHDMLEAALDLGMVTFVKTKEGVKVGVGQVRQAG